VHVATFICLLQVDAIFVQYHMMTSLVRQIFINLRYSLSAIACAL